VFYHCGSAQSRSGKTPSGAESQEATSNSGDYDLTRPDPPIICSFPSAASRRRWEVFLAQSMPPTPANAPSFRPKKTKTHIPMVDEATNKEQSATPETGQQPENQPPPETEQQQQPDYLMHVCPICKKFFGPSPFRIIFVEPCICI